MAEEMAYGDVKKKIRELKKMGLTHSTKTGGWMTELQPEEAVKKFTDRWGFPPTHFCLVSWRRVDRKMDVYYLLLGPLRPK